MDVLFFTMQIDEDRFNKGETSLRFHANDGSFTEFVINFARNTVKATAMGFSAHPMNSSDIINITFDDIMRDLVHFAVGTGKAPHSRAELPLNEETKKALIKYLNNIIAKIQYAKQVRNLSHLPKISLSSPVPLVEDVEAHIGSFITGEKGSVQQQTNKIRKKIKNLNGGRATRRAKRLSVPANTVHTKRHGDRRSA